jgi:tetratricopeptide (TPR) repeat protein
MSQRIAKRVLLVGWDAADWQMIQPLLQQGMMPTLASVIKNGVRGNLATIQPALSPMLWNSIATGKRADKHGIAGFIEPKPDRTGIRPVTSTSRKCKAIWNILTQAGMKSNVVSWFASHPAEPIRGSIVSDRYPAAIKASDRERIFPEGTFSPATLEQNLAPLLVKPSELPIDALLPFIPRAAEIDQGSDDRLIKLAGLLSRASSVHAAACHLVRQGDWDLTAVYYSAIDEFGHTFMPYHPPRLEGILEHDAAVYQDVMVGCYRFHDMMLEALLAYAGPDTTVIIASDHGFHSTDRRPGTDGCHQPVQWHREFGIACIQGPGIRRGEHLYGATLLDITPTILSMLGLPVGRDMDGRSWLEIFENPTENSWIESWENAAGDAGMHPETAREDPVGAAEVMRQLIDLGYIDAPSDDIEETIRSVIRDQKSNLAIALFSSRRAARAINLWKELIDEYPDETGFRIQLASCYFQLGELEKCGDCLDHIDSVWSSSPFVRLMRASLALRNGDSDSALKIIRDVQREKRKDPAILNRLGELLVETKCWKEAEKAFADSLAELTDNPVALNGLAQIAVERDDFAMAVEYALSAVGLVHFYPAAHFQLGLALSQIDRESEAIAAFETCLAMGHRASDAHYELAMLYRQRDPRKSKEHERQMNA